MPLPDRMTWGSIVTRSDLHFLAAVIVTASAAAAQTSAPTLLIASPQAVDPDFRRSVILLVHAASDGAIGLMLNRPTRADAVDVFPELKSPKAAIFAGGPILIGVNALVRSKIKPAGATNLFADVWLVADRSTIQKLAAASPAAFRIYVGQCGWTASQLQDEMRRGLWTAAPARAGVVFNPLPDTLWTRLTATRPAAK
jgi:putative transcriptional regulator